MPAFRTCGRRWNHGSDDFAVPALVAIVLRLLFFILIAGVLFFFYSSPMECSISVPKDLYGTLFGILLLLMIVSVNEAIIFAMSTRGSIMNTAPRRHISKAIYVRVVLFLVEAGMIIFSTYIMFNEKTKQFSIECEEVQPLMFAQGVVISVWVVMFIYGVGFLLISDPCGLFTSSLQEEISRFYEVLFNKKEQGTGSVKEMLLRDAAQQMLQVNNGKPIQLHKGSIRYTHLRTKLEKFFRFIGIKNNNSQRFAVDNLARALHGLFGDLDLVPSDMIAGLILLRRSQKREQCEDRSLVEPLRELTMEHLVKYEPEHIPNNYEYEPPVEVDFVDPVNQEIVKEMCYYINYATGMYGWHLHVYMNVCCGFCQLARMTCCKSRRNHPRVVEEDFVKDNLCLCGTGTFRIHTNREEEDIIFISFENELFEIPFSVSLDHNNKTVVLSVRGTLSIQDAITDMNVYPEYFHVDDCTNCYIHGGFLRSAQWIETSIRDKEVFKRAFEGREDYQLVITGHSLGAAVASVLAVLYRPNYPNLRCYAFSPPGCVFSLPLAYHTRSYIKSFVVGNDLVPRLNWRTLNYFKRSMLTMLHKCKQSKHQVLFRGLFIRACSKLSDDPTFTVKDLLDSLWLEKQIKTTEGKRAMDEEKARSIEREKLSQNTPVSKNKNVNWRHFQKNVRKKRPTVLQRTLQKDLVPEMPAFCPGDILVVKIHRTRAPGCLKRCYPNSIASTTRNSPEEMCVFEIDDTSLENHMPQTVVKALSMLSKQIEPLINRQADVVQYRPDEKLLDVKVVGTDATADNIPEDSMKIELTAEVLY